MRLCFACTRNATLPANMLAGSGFTAFRAARLEDKLLSVRHQDRVDDVNDAVGCNDIRFDDVGVVDLHLFIKSITSLPIIVVNTHSHPDHSGSNNQFKKVYAHPADFDMLRFFGIQRP